MIELIITIVTFSSMVLLFKYFEIIKINNLQAITANYFTAGILSLLNLSFNIRLSECIILIHPLFFGFSLIIGLLFVITFNFYAKGELYSRTSDIDYLNLRNGNRYDES